MDATRLALLFARGNAGKKGNGMSTFEAGVQYNDFVGTVAADISDNVKLLDLFKERELINYGERIVAVRVASGENSGVEVTEVSVVAYLLNEAQFEPMPRAVRAVEVRLPMSVFLSFYKRFDMVMTHRGVDLDNAKVDGPHHD